MSPPKRDVDVVRLRTLFDKVVELSPAERTAALERHCRGDEALRVELEKLLRAADADDDFLEPPSAVAPLSQLDSFRLEGVRPEGMEANAHLAIDAGGERVYCALATLVGDGAQALERMRSLGPRLMGLQDPSIARVREVGLTEAGEGPTSVYCLCSLPAVGGPLPPLAELAAPDREALPATVRGALSAVDKAHGLGLLHGNLNRASLWLDGTGHLQVMGWGAATIAAGPGPEDRSLVEAMRDEQDALQEILRGSGPTKKR